MRLARLRRFLLNCCTKDSWCGVGSLRPDSAVWLRAGSAVWLRPGSAVWLRPQRMGCEWMRPREAWKSVFGHFIRRAFACGFSEAALPAASAKPRYLRFYQNRATGRMANPRDWRKAPHELDSCGCSWLFRQRTPDFVGDGRRSPAAIGSIGI